MPFTVLTDADVKQIFASLTASEVGSIADALGQGLASYACDGEGEYQPHRAVITRPSKQVTLFMPATTQQAVGCKIVGVAPSQDASKLAPGEKLKPALQSVLTICDAEGAAIGVLNAAELTAFRTSLGSMLLYRFRKTTDNIVVFGAGKQALWHVRLAIILRGEAIRKITIVNRSQQRALDLAQELQESAWPEHITLQTFDRATSPEEEYEKLVAGADAIFCTTPSTEPLFPARYLTSETARAKTRFMSAIGSYRLDMAEMDPELLKTVVDPSGVFAEQVWKAKIAVDSIDGCMQEAGELVSAGIKTEEMLEIGRIQEGREESKAEGLQEWLESGFVVYKSVGVGIMDIAIGEHLIKLAASKDIGYTLPTF